MWVRPASYAAFISLAVGAMGCGGDGNTTDPGDASIASRDAITFIDSGEPPMVDLCETDAGRVDCSGMNTACSVGRCDPQTGMCVLAPSADGLTCDDSDPCTKNDSCQQGTCTGQSLNCEAQSTACVPSICDPQIGACVTSTIADGTACDDDSACTTASSCQGGVCMPSAYLDCSGLADACNAGSCDAQMGCVAAPLVGTPCDDADPCTSGDRCNAAGQCKGQALNCEALAGPCEVGICDSNSSSCVVTPAQDGTACDDGSVCTSGDTCTAGACVGSSISCPTGGACEVASCDPITGCTVAARADGDSCSDGDACTANDLCLAGQCQGSAVDCSGFENNCNTAACDPTSGACRRTALANGTSCDSDPSDCTTDRCSSGVCAQVAIAECTACGGAGDGLICRAGLCDTPVVSETEDFEAPTLPTGFSTSGSGAWAPTPQRARSGIQSLGSPNLGHGQSAGISRNVFVGGSLIIRFSFRTSSQASSSTQPGDALVFRVDGTEVRRWSGVLPWGTFSHTLYDDGDHVLSWSYEKDGSGVAGADRVYLDDLQLSELVSFREDVESFSFSAPFSTSGNLPFTVDTTQATSGSRSLRSGAVTHNQTSSLFYSVTSGRWSRLGFALRTQTLGPGDRLVVYEDGVPGYIFEGTTPWDRWGLTLAPGTHVIEWRFTRDGSGGTGSNAVWLDDFYLQELGCN